MQSTTKQAQYCRKYYQENKDKHAEYMREYREANSDKVAEIKRNYRHANKNKIANYMREYRSTNKDKIAEIRRNYRQNSKQARLAHSLRNRLWKILKGVSKSKTMLTIIGCTYEELIRHFEKQFTDGMTWDNYGKNGWEVDHIIPCIAFDLTDLEQQRLCFNYTNLRPLWVEDNLSKGGKLNV